MGNILAPTPRQNPPLLRERKKQKIIYLLNYMEDHQNIAWAQGPEDKRYVPSG